MKVDLTKEEKEKQEEQARKERERFIEFCRRMGHKQRNAYKKYRELGYRRLQAIKLVYQDHLNDLARARGEKVESVKRRKVEAFNYHKMVLESVKKPNRHQRRALFAMEPREVRIAGRSKS